MYNRSKKFLYGLYIGVVITFLAIIPLSCTEDYTIMNYSKGSDTPSDTLNPTKGYDARSSALTIEAIEPCTLYYANGAKGDVRFRVDGGAENIIASGAIENIIIFTGQKVSFYGDNVSTYNESVGVYSRIYTSAYAYLYGNVMSLLDSKNFANDSILTSERAFYGLFSDASKLRSHSVKALVLPATTLTKECYMRMFEGCSSMKTPPALPANMLTYKCYAYMFDGCTSIKKAPDLPALDLDVACYYQMFTSCTGMSSAPALPATVLADSCENCMFSGCTVLKTAPALHSESLKKDCYSNMFSGCTSLVTAPVLPATVLAEGCYSQMFSSCMTLRSAPLLPAPVLTEKCYYSMFENCSNLSYIKCKATDTSATDCTTNWLKDVAATGIFEKVATATWTEDTPSGVPTGWTLQDE